MRGHESHWFGEFLSTDVTVEPFLAKTKHTGWLKLSKNAAAELEYQNLASAKTLKNTQNAVSSLVAH